MSKSNADFSAFDFNDSSENSLNSRSIFLNRGGLGSVANSGAGEGGGSINGGCSSSQATSEIGGGGGGCGVDGDDDDGDDGDENVDGDGDDDDDDGDTNINSNNEGSNALDAVSVAIANSKNNGAAASAGNCATGTGANVGSGVGSGAANCSDVLVNNFNDVRSGSASLSNNSAATTGGLGGGGGSGGGGGGGGSAGDGSSGNSSSKKYRHQNYSKNIYIGTKNAEKWELTRTRLAFKNDVEFVAYLLNLAENDTERSSSLASISSTTKNFPNFKMESNLTVKDFSNSQTENCNDPLPLTKPPPKLKKRVQFHSPINGFTKTKDFPNFSMKVPKHDAQDKSISSSLDTDAVPEVLDCRIAEKIKSELAEKSASIQNDESFKGALCLKKTSAETYQIFNHSDAEDDDDFDDDDDNDEEEAGILNPADKNFRIRDRSKIKKSSKASLFNGKIKQEQQSQPTNGSELQSDDDYDDDGDDGDDGDEGMLATEIKNEQNFIEEDDEHNEHGGIRSCRECTVMHDYEHCPLRNSVCYIKDTVDLSTWIERKNIEALEKLKSESQRIEEGRDANDLDEENSSQSSDDARRSAVTFAEASIPNEFELRNIDETTFGVFAKSDIPLLTKLGPIIGKPVQVNDIPDDSNMKTIFEICEGDRKSDLISCDDPNTSNWLRFIRPAMSYEERNANLVSLDRQAFLVTCREVKAGFELLYWSDDCNTMWRKKHTEKTNCGGCNLKFEHPLFYRTHCSVFHDPSFSLTIRKYHCKVCGEAVLGKDNIMKHAAEMHEGKGAYQCQFCNKFFLRLNYLEMHRTYGCSANPQRARPLCDFCGRKFCQPQKLKVHIKRMHSDLAEVLRDFQCKLCSKLLGSRAALQRHSKEVHSRNSAVVSCPRCQKLFQNRSNLKIHMLTHSGVRPFKCAESECTAAFTTKQCLQFHYKKVHNYTQEQMPKIERSVAYTFDAYSGGMKVDFLEQAPRRRRKSLEDQNSLLSSSMLDSKSDTEFSDDLFESIKKSGKSIKDLCRNETNLSLLSSKINNIFTKEVGRKRKKKQRPISPKEVTNGMNDEDEHMELVRRKQNAQLSLVETFLSKTAQRISEQQQASAAAVAAIVEGTDVADKLHMATGNSEISGDHENSFRQHDHMGNSASTPTYKHSPTHAMMQRQNLVVSKGSKKWISNDDRHMSRDCPSTSGVSMASPFVSGNHQGNNNISMGVPPGGVDDPSKLLPNRDFLARLMGSTTSEHHNHPIAHEEDENSSFLDVVDSNNPGAVNSGQMNQFHHNGVADQQQMQHMNSIAHSQSFMNTFYNNSNARLTSGGGAASSSASMLVEAALNSVGSIMDNDGAEMKAQVNTNLDNGNPMNSQIEVEGDRFGAGNMSNMDNLENEIKLMKNLNNFPMQIPPLPMYPASANSMNSCNISPDTSTPTDPQSNQNNNDIDVDAGSTPRGQHMGTGGGGGGDSESFSNHHQTPPSPQAISPGRDYSIFGSNDNPANGGGGPSIAASSPLPSMQQRRNASSVGASGGSGYTDHELISPASSPSIPRYNFSGNDICRKRDDDNERPHNMSGHNQLSSDDENSILPQNSGQDMRMKFTQSQMDLVYSKYESMANAANLKYGNNQDLEVPSDYRNNSNNDLSDLQGLDMTSRSNVGANYHHNFQLPPSSSNLGLGRYHHHIYDILSEREQQQQQQQQQQHHHQQQQEEHSSQLSMQQHQTMHNHNLLPDQLSDQDHDQTTSVDLSRTANYVVSSPPQIPYNHPHHDVLRMVSLDLTPNGNMGVGNNRSFLPSQIQHNNRDTIDHHRLLSTAEQHRLLAASNADQHRLLVDPTAHLLMEQNNRLLSSDQSRLLGESAAAQNRHMAAARGFGAYHQVASGSRAALQRHSKEVHSRNSAVVSCPRCQKLFQNRSNLKIHMLTHSGVRPFKCAESECTAAFTTKQCLQFHYKKVHNYTQEQMPKIERSVAYTFDAYSGGMKVDFLEQAPRRRRKSLEDQNSLLSSSMLDSKSDTEFSDDLFESIKKSGKSIKDLCRNETNLSLLSSKINNIFTKEVGRKRKKKQRPISPKEVTNGMNDEDEHMELVRRKQNAQLSLVETFLSKTAQRISEQQQASAAAVAAIVEGTDVADKLHMATGNSEISGDHENSFRQHDHMGNSASTPTYKHSPTHAMMQRQNLVVSKGSKKWISNDDRHMSRDCPSTSGVSMASPFVSGNHQGNNNIGMGVPPGGVDDPSKLLPNRDFLARLMGSTTSEHHNHPIAHEEDENSSFLDVVDSNNPGAVNSGQMNQFHHNGVADQQQMQHMNSIAHSQSFMNTFYNNSNARLTSGGGAASSSASMLVEAALNSVGSIMDNDGAEMKAQVNTNLDNGNPMNSQIEVEGDRFGAGNMSNMDNLENEIKLMKNLNNFPMQIPPLPMYPASANSMNSCNISPDTSTPTDPQSNQNNNDIDVDAGSTPRGQHMGTGGGGGGDSESFSNHHQTPPSPQAISPGRDYSIFGSNDNPANGGGGPSIAASSPLPSMQQRRNASSVGASGGSGYTDHELISPASSPSIPRYNFSGNDICRKRDDDNERPHNMSGHNQLSSDDENSILPQNSGQDMRMKFTQSQMDLVYSKYESMANAANLKYGNNQYLEVPSDYRNNSNNDLSDLQGLDMTSRSNVGANYHHNFQLPPSSSNLGLGRYHHHIYDILSEREQQQQQQQQQQHHHQQQQEEHSSQLSMQQHQTMHNHNLLPDQLSDQDHDQTTSVDLSRTANYVVSSPPQIPYNHPHHDVLRMVSLDLTPNGNMGVGNNRSFLPSQIQHNNRDTIDHHRLLSTAEQHRLLAASNADQHRLLVDPTAHLLMEQNNRLLSSDQSRLLGESAAAQNRHMAAARGFGAYHQVASGNYHPSVRPVLPSPNHHTSNPSNYHPSQLTTEIGLNFLFPLYVL